jgi:PAS domain S-box-containing protein
MVEKDKTRLVLTKLLESSSSLTQIMQNVDQVVWISDPNTGAILYVNQAFTGVWGRSRDSLLADPLMLIESVHPEDRLQVMVTRQTYNKQPSTQSFRILRPDGEMRWVVVRAFLIRDEAGDQDILINVARDITDQKQVDLALHKTLDRAREQFDLSRRMSLARKPEAVLKTLMSAHELRLATRAALVFFVDPQAGPAHGVEIPTTWMATPEVVPWTSEPNLYEEPDLWELLFPNRTLVIPEIDTDPRLSIPLRTILREAQIQTMAIFPLVATGEWLGSLFVFFKEERLFDHIGVRHLKIMVDQAAVTLYNLKLLTIEEESRHEAERANEIKTKFLAMISHELRTPLTSIIGFISTLMAEDVIWEPEEQRDFFRTIQLEADRLQELIDHLLDLSRLEAGRLPIIMKPQSVHEIIEDASSQLRILTTDHNLTYNLSANLPQVLADTKRIAQVLVNLVRNASTYAPKGTEINISTIVRKNFLQINVIDQGPGIGPGEYKKVFEAFRRGALMENGSGQGAGLGLAICKGLVEAHGGRIWVKRKSTAGATFSFTIPLISLQDQEIFTEAG